MRLEKCSPRVSGLVVAITVALTSSSCVLETSLVDPTQVIAPVTVRGDKSLFLTLEVRNATGIVTDTVYFFSQIAYVTTVVSGYSSGSCIIEMSDSYHVPIATDSFDGNAEVINRKFTATMPVRLRIDLQGFTGKITSMIIVTPFEATGLDARFSLRDSMGAERTSFRFGESIDFAYSFFNKSSTAQEWWQSLALPFGRFSVSKGDSVVLDSFAGKGWLAEGAAGTILPGDSLYTTWSGVSSGHPLAPGQYLAKVEPTFTLEHFGYPATIEKAFMISP